MLFSYGTGKSAMGALVAQSLGQAPFTSEIVCSNLGSDSLHSCEKS